jgi:hypothetical protein
MRWLSIVSPLRYYIDSGFGGVEGEWRVAGGVDIVGIALLGFVLLAFSLTWFERSLRVTR